MYVLNVKKDVLMLLNLVHTCTLVETLTPTTKSIIYIYQLEHLSVFAIGF